jgi:hypothetical protein
VETKELLKELEYAILSNDKRCQNEILDILEAGGINREEACIICFNIYLRGQ